MSYLTLISPPGTFTFPWTTHQSATAFPQQRFVISDSSESSDDAWEAAFASTTEDQFARMIAAVDLEIETGEFTSMNDFLES